MVFVTQDEGSVAGCAATLIDLVRFLFQVVAFPTARLRKAAAGSNEGESLWGESDTVSLTLWAS